MEAAPVTDETGYNGLRSTASFPLTCQFESDIAAPGPSKSLKVRTPSIRSRASQRAVSQIMGPPFGGKANCTLPVSPATRA